MLGTGQTLYTFESNLEERGNHNNGENQNTKRLESVEFNQLTNNLHSGVPVAKQQGSQMGSPDFSGISATVGGTVQLRYSLASAHGITVLVLVAR